MRSQKVGSRRLRRTDYVKLFNQDRVTCRLAPYGALEGRMVGDGMRLHGLRANFSASLRRDSNFRRIRRANVRHGFESGVDLLEPTANVLQ
jgi:hypothetical protein